MASDRRLPRDQPLRPVIPEGLTVKVIGLGGVGGIATRYLAMFLASFEAPVRMVLIDGDNFEVSNASRMYFSGCGNKAAVTRDDILQRFADTSLTLLAVEQYVTAENVDRLIRSGDLVILAVDNHATRKLVNEHCARLDDVALFSGGNDGVGADAAGKFVRGTYGNCQIYIRRNGQDASPSLTRYHPEIRDPADKLPTDLSCTELVASVPQILFTNLATASAMLNAVWLYLCEAIHYSELSFDIADGLMRPVPLPAPLLTPAASKEVQPA